MNLFQMGGTLGMPGAGPKEFRYLYIFASQQSCGNFVVVSSSLAAYFSVVLDLFYARQISPNAPVPSFLTSLKFLHTTSSEWLAWLPCVFPDIFRRNERIIYINYKSIYSNQQYISKDGKGHCFLYETRKSPSSRSGFYGLFLDILRSPSSKTACSYCMYQCSGTFDRYLFWMRARSEAILSASSLGIVLRSFEQSQWSQNYKQTLPMSNQFQSRRVSSQVRLAILEIYRKERPSFSSFQFLTHKNACSSSFYELTCMVNAWFHFTSLYSTKSAVVSKDCFPTSSRMYVPLFIGLTMMASTTVALMVLLGALLQSLTFASFFLSSKMATVTLPLFLLMQDISKDVSRLMSSFSLRQMRLTPRNFFMPLISHQDSQMMRSISDSGNLKSSLKMQSPSLSQTGSFSVWQLSQPYLSTKNGMPVISLGPMSSKQSFFIVISRGGTWTTLSIFMSETSMNAMPCLSRLKISTRSLGISGLLNSIMPEPMNLQAKKTERVRWGYPSWRYRMESQLKRCLSEGMKQGLIFFSAFPILTLKVGISSKVLDLMHTLYSQLFFIIYKSNNRSNKINSNC